MAKASSLTSATNTTAKPVKAEGFQLWRDVLGSPRYVVAPMVDQSELAWRILSRLYGAQLCYTPMIHAALFSSPSHPRYRSEQFNLEFGEEGDPVLDRPLIAQFCANDPEVALRAAKQLEDTGRVDAVDLNLGCPQGIAKKGKYGAFLMEDWDLIRGIISNIGLHSKLPITAKFRCYPSASETVSYATHIHSAGAQILTLHGRTRAQKGQLAGLADWTKIAAVKSFLSSLDSDQEGKGKGKARVPLFANGNILISEDVERCLAATGAEGVMSAEGNLYNPAIFLPLNSSGAASYRTNLPLQFKAALDEVDVMFPSTREGKSERQGSLDLAFPDSVRVAMQYLAICRTLRTPTAGSAIKGHLYKLWRPIFENRKHLDLRDKMGRLGAERATDGVPSHRDIVEPYWKIAIELRQRLEEDRRTGVLVETFDLPEPLPAGIPLPTIPYSRAQPYFRPLPPADVPSSGDAPVNPTDLQNARESAIVADGERNPKRVKLDGSTTCAREGCANAASAKCPRGACKSCCDKVPPSESEGEIPAGKEGMVEGQACEAHKARLEIERQREEERKMRKEMKRERVRAQKQAAAARKEAAVA